MKVNSLSVHGHCLPCLALFFLFVQACASARTGGPSPPVGLEPGGTHDLSGVWTGTAVESCTPLRLGAFRSCGSRSNIMFTIIQERADVIRGFYAANSGRFQENGRVIGMPAHSARLWLRVMMTDHSSCIFSSALPRDAMRGAYLCFRDGSSFDRGYWMARRSY